MIALPGEEHFARWVRGEITADEIFKRCFIHPEIAAGVELALLKKIAVLAGQVAGGPGRLDNAVKRAVIGQRSLHFKINRAGPSHVSVLLCDPDVDRVCTFLSLTDFDRSGEF